MAFRIVIGMILHVCPGNMNTPLPKNAPEQTAYHQALVGLAKPTTGRRYGGYPPHLAIVSLATEMWATTGFDSLPFA